MTYKEEQEVNYAEQQLEKSESVAHRFIKGLEDKIGVPNAFGSEDLEDEPEDVNEDDDEEAHEIYNDEGGYN